MQGRRNGKVSLTRFLCRSVLSLCTTCLKQSRAVVQKKRYSSNRIFKTSRITREEAKEESYTKNLTDTSPSHFRNALRFRQTITLESVCERNLSYLISFLALVLQDLYISYQQEKDGSLCALERLKFCC